MKHRPPAPPDVAHQGSRTSMPPVHLRMTRVFLCLLLCGAGGFAMASVPADGQRMDREALTDEFIKERRALRTDLEVLREQHKDADPAVWLEARRAWHLENRSRMETVRALAEQMGRDSGPPPERPQITLEAYEARLPEAVSPAMRAFMLERFQLRQARIESGLDEPGLSDEARRTRREAFAASQQQRRERIASLSEQVAAESAAQPRSEPPPVGQWQPPADLPEAMQTYMLERHKIRRAEWELRQTLADKTPAEQENAVRDFRRGQNQTLAPLREAAHNSLSSEVGNRKPEVGHQ